MSYSEKTAARTFSTGESGERIFSPFSFLGRSYLIEDHDTEQRICKKKARSNTAFIFFLVAGFAGLTLLDNQFLNEPMSAVCCVALIIICSWLLDRYFLGDELSKLKRVGWRAAEKPIMVASAARLSTPVIVAISVLLAIMPIYGAHFCTPRSS